MRWAMRADLCVLKWPDPGQRRCCASWTRAGLPLKCTGNGRMWSTDRWPSTPCIIAPTQACQSAVPPNLIQSHFPSLHSLHCPEWSQVNVPAPAEDHTIPGLSPDTLYTIRIRAHDLLGPGKLSNPVSVRTLPPAKRPFVVIPEGPEIRVPPKVPFGINCNLSRGDPIPEMHWESRGHNISAAQQSRHIALQHSGLYEVLFVQMRAHPTYLLAELGVLVRCGEWSRPNRAESEEANFGWPMPLFIV